MGELFHILGSFATTWLAIWFVCAVALLVFYPVIRKLIFNWNPATASHMLLLLLAFPFLLSLSTTIMLFVPLIESNLVSAHCHDNCQTHLPLLESTWVSITGLVITLLLLAMALKKFIENYSVSNNLMNQLSALANDRGNWHVLPESRPFVFTLGWWRSKVFITQGLLQQCTADDVDIILQHEHAHVRRLDNIRLLMTRFFLLVLPQRLAHKLYSDLHFLTESACDFAAAERFGKLNVAETLLRVQKLVPWEFDYLDRSLVSAFTGSEVELRIRNLVTDSSQLQDPRFGKTGFLAIFVVLSFVLVDPLHHGIEWLIAFL